MLIKAFLEILFYDLNPKYIFVGMECQPTRTIVMYQHKETLELKKIVKPYVGA